MSSATGKRQWVSSSPVASVVFDCTDTPQPSPKRVARVSPGTDEPPEVSPEDEEELFEALRAVGASRSSPKRVPRVPLGMDGRKVSLKDEEELLEASRADDTSQSGRAPRCQSPSAGATAGADPADVTTWFPRVPQATAGLPPRLYPWQAQCLAAPGVAEGMKSLVYAAPTSGGKTLVAEILMLKAVLAGGKVMFVQPFVALVKEKELSMKKLLRPIDKRVSGFHGKQRPHSRFDVAICTFEKALILSSLLQREGRLHELKLVVVDELHMVRDEYRGYILEILLTKLRYLSSYAAESAAATTTQLRGPQVVAMSATVPNLDELANWLNAEVFKTDFRPVTLSEFVVVHSHAAPGSADGKHSGSGLAYLRQHTTARVFRAMSQQPVRELRLDISDVDGTKCSDSSSGARPRPYFADLAAVSSLCREVGCCLVFCAVKKACEEAAEWIAAAACRRAAAAAVRESGPAAASMQQDFAGMPGPTEAQQWIDLEGTTLSDELIDRRRDLLEHLSQLPHPTHKLHRQTVPVGVAFHHSGLSDGERKLIEAAFRNKTLRVICATSTLATGVNLPADRVLMRGPWADWEHAGGMSIDKYKQMVGRAGRAGHAAHGDSFLLCESTAGAAVEAMLRAAMPRVESCLLATPRMKQLLLEGFGTGLVRTIEQVELYLQATLLWHSAEYAELHACVKGCIGQLIEEGVIEWSAVGQEFRPTSLGLATSAAGIESKEARQTHHILTQAIDRGLNLSCHSGASNGFGALHLLFISIPPSWTDSNHERASVPPVDFVGFHQRFCRLNEHGAIAAQLCGIEEGKVAVAAQSRRLAKSEDPEPYVRFWLAQLLLDLIAERSQPEAIAAEARISTVRLEHLRTDTCNRAAALSHMCGTLAEAVAAAAAAAQRSTCSTANGNTRTGGGWAHLAELLGRASLEIQTTDGRIADSKLLEVEAMAEWQARALWAAGVTSPAQLARMPPQRVCAVLARKGRGGSRAILAKRLVEKAKVCAALLKREEIADALAEIPQALLSPASDSEALAALADRAIDHK